MTSLKRLIFYVSTGAILISCPFFSVYAQQGIQGSGNYCNAQVQGNNHTTVNIYCNLPNTGTVRGSPNTGTVKSSQIRLRATVDNLRGGSKLFTLWLKNETSDQIIEVSTPSLGILDNLGNTYELRWPHVETKKFPPNSQIKVNYGLKNPISPNATAITFTLDDIWGTPKDVALGWRPLPLVQWKIRLN